jgi:flagellar FliL protein
MSEMDEVVASETIGEAVNVKLPVVPLVAAVIVSVVIATGCVGGFLYWAIKSGKLPVGGGNRAVEVVKVEPIPTKLVALDPLLVNLADEGGRSYLRLALTLRVEDPPQDKNAKAVEGKPEKGPPKNENEAAERDTALTVLGKETSEQLLAPEGKEEMKGLLKNAFTQRVPEVKVDEVLITEFLVQR